MSYEYMNFGMLRRFSLLTRNPPCVYALSFDAAHSD
jgi:hypothetical protein